MTGQLNPTVNGSSGTCIEGADWLGDLTIAGRAAADKVCDAQNAAYSGWRGPASQAYHDSIRGVGRDADDLAYTAENYGRAVREFADALDAVIARMDDALQKATAGGLEVDGPFIVPPAPVINQHPSVRNPPIPVGSMNSNGDFQSNPEYTRAWETYQEIAREYNRKVEVFNTCKAIVSDARNREDEAHANLRDALEAPEGSSLDAWTVGSVAASRVASTISAFENPRKEAFIHATRLSKEATFYQKWALGTVDDLDSWQREQLTRAAAKARMGQLYYQQRVNQFEQYIKHVPQQVRDWVSYYPGKEKLHGLPPDATANAKTAQKVLKRLPAVGSLLVIGTEANDALKGEQTWTKAAVDSGANLAGGALGAAGALAVYGAITGSSLRPVGTAVVGTGGAIVGAIVGAIGGQAAADFFVPE